MTLKAGFEWAGECSIKLAINKNYVLVSLTEYFQCSIFFAYNDCIFEKD